jgi:hypothetical protein
VGVISEGDRVVHKTLDRGEGVVTEKAFDTFNRDWYVLVWWDLTGISERVTLLSVEEAKGNVRDGA